MKSKSKKKMSPRSPSGQMSSSLHEDSSNQLVPPMRGGSRPQRTALTLLLASSCPESSATLTLTPEFPKQPCAPCPACGSWTFLPASSEPALASVAAPSPVETLSEDAATCVPLFTARLHLQGTHSLEDEADEPPVWDRTVCSHRLNRVPRFQNSDCILVQCHLLMGYV